MDQRADRALFRTLIERLAGAFGRDSDRATLQGYWMALEDLAIEDIAAAVKVALKQCQHMPRPVEIRRLAGERPPEADAAAAWEIVAETVGRVGRYQGVDFADGRINAAIRRMGGWPRLCSRGGDDFHTWARKEFLEAFGEFVARRPPAGTTEALPGAMPGEPVLVGDGGEQLRLGDGS